MRHPNLKTYKLAIIYIILAPFLLGGSCQPKPENLLPARATTLNYIGKNLYAHPDGIYEVDNPLTTINVSYERKVDYYAFKVSVRTEGFVYYQLQWIFGHDALRLQKVDGPIMNEEFAFMRSQSIRLTGLANGLASYNRQMDALLESGNPVYFISDEKIGDGYVDEEFSLLIPSSLLPGELKIYTTSPNPQGSKGQDLILVIRESPYNLYSGKFFKKHIISSS